MHLRTLGAGRLHLLALGGWLALANASAAIKDVPFIQDVSIKFQTAATLSNATLRRLEFDRNGVAYVLFPADDNTALHRIALFGHYYCCRHTQCLVAKFGL